jgi:hypothetical protein
MLCTNTSTAKSGTQLPFGIHTGLGVVCPSFKLNRYLVSKCAKQTLIVLFAQKRPGQACVPSPKFGS